MFCSNADILFSNILGLINAISVHIFFNSITQVKTCRTKECLDVTFMTNPEKYARIIGIEDVK